MLKETDIPQAGSSLRTEVEGKLLLSTKEILVTSPRAISSIWIRLKSYEQRTIEASYDRNTWWGTTWEWVNAAGYNRTRKFVDWDPEEEEALYDMNGNPISASTKAKESRPKIEPPLWEEREV